MILDFKKLYSTEEINRICNLLSTYNIYICFHLDGLIDYLAFHNYDHIHMMYRSSWNGIGVYFFEENFEPFFYFDGQNLNIPDDLNKIEKLIPLLS